MHLPFAVQFVAPLFRTCLSVTRWFPAVIVRLHDAVVVERDCLATYGRDDAQISFAWGGGSPALHTIGKDGFSVRWTRNLELAAGRSGFSRTLEDGGHLWVNGHLLTDAWKDQASRT
jgi:hypothetical protein